MRIAYVVPGCGVSGGVATACQHANRLLARGHDVFVVSESQERDLQWFPNQRVPVVGLESIPSDVDALIATGWSTSFRVALLEARHKFYFVQSDETRFHPQNSAWEHITRQSYGLSMNYLTEARWIRAWLKDGFDQDAELVPNGLDDRIFYPTEPLVPKGRRLRVLLEGAIDLPYKGMAEAFRAVAQEDVEVWCVSSYGRPKKGWRCDRFFERVSMDEMRRIYSSCDLLLKLSRVEGFFGPPLEMMACGGVAVVGKVTGFDEYIEDGVNALVVDPLDTAQAAAAVRRVINEPELRDRLKTAGAETARKWQWDPSIDTLERYYVDVLEGRRGIRPIAGEQDRSIAYFYGVLRGDDWFLGGRAKSGRDLTDIPGERGAAGLVRGAGLSTSGTIARMQSDPTEVVLDRLRYQRWFRAFATMAYVTRQRSKRLKKSLKSRLRGLLVG